ncbi:MAG TPA: PAS domain S-box protein [Conexivisphaerales archaeon]|nr:PAS domain S-box protein [Conexivisphaerales archaeon]
MRSKASPGQADGGWYLLSKPPLLVAVWLLFAGSFLILSDFLLLGALPGRDLALEAAALEDVVLLAASGAFLYYLARSHIRAIAVADSAREIASHALRTYLTSSPLAISILNLKGSVVLWNPPAERILGWKEEEIAGKPEPSIPPEDDSVFQSQLQGVFKGERIDGLEQTRMSKDGIKVDVLLTMIPIQDSKGSIWGAAELMEDISERKLERAALIDTNRIFRSTFEDAAIGMAMTGLDGRLLKVNPALCHIFGYTEEELLTFTFQDLTYTEDLPAELEYNRQMIEGTISSYQTEKRYVRQDGKIVWVALSVSLVHDAKGKPLYSVAQFQDITSRKAAEEELKNYSVGLEKMVKDRTSELEQAHAQLVRSERLAAVGSMAAQVAHDLRNPLTAINTNLYYIKNALPQRMSAKVEDSIKAMEGAVEHSSKIIDDLLEYSRAAELKEERLDLSDLVRGCMEGYPLPGLVKLEEELEPGLFTVGDVAKLRRVVQNIVSNAVEAMPDGGTLRVFSRGDGDRAVLEFIDTGIGMDEKTRSQLFNPFFTTKAKGLGLGLAICRRLVEAHDGEIDIGSQLGRGTRVKVSLPRARPPAS